MSARHEDAFPVAQTFSGPVRGKLKNGVCVFLGIRYGAPPLGVDRFKPSRRPQPWSETADAFSFGNPATQMTMGLEGGDTPSAVLDALAPILPSADDRAAESEDCLFLNVWTPALGDEGKRPVMVWLHGGGFVAGSAGWPVYDGAALAGNGNVVVVSINHRLGALGFLYLGDLAGPSYLQSGNAGMLDIMLALWWVRDNISHFGGDAANVTVFGESGGGFKVATLLGMRSARGLVHKAIIQSGPLLRCLSRDAANANTRAVLAELGFSLPDDMARLNSLPARCVTEASEAARQKAVAEGRPFALAPVIDGMTIDAHPFHPVAALLAQKIPLLIGHTRDEGTFFIATNPKFGAFTEEDFADRAATLARDNRDAAMATISSSRPGASATEKIADLWSFAWAFAGTVAIAERKAVGGTPVYVYMLDWRTPVLDGVLGATHALDVPLVFGTVEAARSLVGSGAEPVTLSEKMQAAWIQFARTGSPNCEQLPDWPSYATERRATMVFDSECHVVCDPFPQMRRIFRA